MKQRVKLSEQLETVWLFLTVPHLALIRVYPIKEVPVEAEALTDWLYQRFVEKEELLAHFYETGLSRMSRSSRFCVKHMCKLNDSAAAVCIYLVLPGVFELGTRLFPVATAIRHHSELKIPAQSITFSTRRSQKPHFCALRFCSQGCSHMTEHRKWLPDR